MLTDDLIAQDVENGMDIGEAIAGEESRAGFWDELFNEYNFPACGRGISFCPICREEADIIFCRKTGRERRNKY